MFEADFADIFEVRGHSRRKRGRVSIATATDDTVVLRYTGLDSIKRHTTIQFDPKPDHLDRQIAIFELNLEPRKRTSLFVTVSCDETPVAEKAGKRFFVGLRKARRALRAAASGAASVETSNAVFNEVLCRSMADLSMLET